MGHMCGLVQSYLPHGEPQHSLLLLHHGSHNTAFHGVRLLTVSTWRVHLLNRYVSAMQDLQTGVYSLYTNKSQIKALVRPLLSLTNLYDILQNTHIVYTQCM